MELSMNTNKKSLFSSKVYVVAIILILLFLVLCLSYIVTGQPPITFINSKPYYTYTKNLRIQGGELSPEDIQKLSRFQWVEKLYIWPVQIYDISFLNSMNDLEELTIGGFPCKIEDWSPINNCSKLSSVFAWNVGLSNLEPFENLRRLKRLELQENNIYDITGIKKLSLLESISIWGDDLHDITPIKYAVNLKQIKIFSTGINDISPLSSLNNLETLILYGCINVSDISSLQHCENLRYLDISNTSVKDYSMLLSNPNLKIKTSNVISELKSTTR